VEKSVETTVAGFGETIAARIEAEHQALAEQWLERLKDRMPVEPAEIFPGPDLLDHIPALLREVGAYLAKPEEEDLSANTLVLAKARELGLLRHQQRASLHQLLREYHVLGGLLATFAAEEAVRLKIGAPASETIRFATRLHQAVQTLMQVTVDTFVGEYSERLRAQNERLEEFNRLVSHELRQPLGTLQFAVKLLSADGTWERSDQRRRLLEVCERNVQRLSSLTVTLEAVARSQPDGDDPVTQEVSTGALAQEVARQLREMADARGVEVVVQGNLPVMKVEVARLELILVNLVANAIKYSDPSKPRRLVEIAPRPHPPGGLVVRDNGLGIPARHLSTIFDRFFRSHSERDGALHVDGVGLGLAIVRDCVRAIGGDIWAESVEGEGTTFHLILHPENAAPLSS
jgi:signal transduction histidine kinase